MEPSPTLETSIVCGKAQSWLAPIDRLDRRPWPLAEDGRRVGLIHPVQWIGLMLGPCENAGFFQMMDM